MEPQVWGPHGWFFLHSITMSYPEKPTKKDMENYSNFFHMIPNVLPCEVCQKHFRQHMAENPIEPALKNGQTLVEWLINIHNMANIILGKPTMTFEQVIEKYKQDYSKGHGDCINASNNNKNNSYYIGIIIVILFIILLFIWKKNVLFA